MPDKKNINIHGDLNVTGDFVAGDKHVTFIQKFFNIFKSDSETLEHRNRRILLGHVENAWIKGVLDASLHGAALSDLGIKQDPEAVTKYPWAIKKESTDETLPAGTSMLEIFDSIGMGRSLLILGAPGSGKTTMLLELARQLIQHAREDVTQPIPMVFNLASWTEKLTLADWLAQELNNLYSVPRKTAPDWVKGNKLFLLLDGLDEVRQESRAKCVEAINAFRKEHGLTSLAVCSRSQDYADLNAKLSFEGAIEVQPLMQGQIAEFFNRFGDEMTGIKRALEKDSALREMAETPLFLNIMVLAYRDKQEVEVLPSKYNDPLLKEWETKKIQYKLLFDRYIEAMFIRRNLKNNGLKKQDVLQWLSWLAKNMKDHNQIPYLIENMQPDWLSSKQEVIYRLILGLVWWDLFLFFYLIGGTDIIELGIGLFFALTAGPIIGRRKININDNWGNFKIGLGGIGWTILLLALSWLIIFLIFGIIVGLIIAIIAWLIYGSSILGSVFQNYLLISTFIIWLPIGITGGAGILYVFNSNRLSDVLSGYSNEDSIGISTSIFFWFIVEFGIVNMLLGGVITKLVYSLIIGLIIWLVFGLGFGYLNLIQQYALRLVILDNKHMPRKFVPFLDHCVDLIFLRRVGGGYIFVHRLLMEHFAEMYVETPASKGN